LLTTMSSDPKRRGLVDRALNRGLVAHVDD
jgi:hypothetical protein